MNGWNWLRPTWLLNRRVASGLLRTLLWVLLVARLLSPLMVGGLRKYRPMPHDVLAKALLNAALSGANGTQVHTYDGIRELAAQNTTR